MAFAEYRGAGKNGASFLSMQDRWDAEWSGVGPAEADLARHENWNAIQRLMPVGGRLLEAGCGLAKWVAFLDAQGFEAHGLDYSPVAIRQSLSRWPGLRLACGDLRAMPYAECTFDGIVSFGAVEHDPEGPGRSLAEMYRVLKPGGILYCTVPCMNVIRRSGLLRLENAAVRNSVIRRLAGRRGKAIFFEYVFTTREYRTHLGAAGFAVKELLPLKPYCIENRAGFLRWAMMALHRKAPWIQAHMMAAVCVKPGKAES